MRFFCQPGGEQGQVTPVCGEGIFTQAVFKPQRVSEAVDAGLTVNKHVKDDNKKAAYSKRLFIKNKAIGFIQA